MAINLVAQAGQTNYKVNRYIIDTDVDVINLPTDKGEVAPGSTAIATITNNQYILDNNYNWILWKQGTTPSGDIHYIWDGGEVL